MRNYYDDDYNVAKTLKSIAFGGLALFPFTVWLTTGPLTSCAQSKAVGESYQYLSEQTAETFNIADFKAYGCKIELEDGSQYRLYMSGSSKDKFVKLSADIGIEDAYEIISLNKQFNNLGISSDSLYYNPFDKKLNKANSKAGEIYNNLINAFANAVKNSFNQKKEFEFDETLLNGSISDSLVFVENIQILDLSNVEQENNKNLYYFYIDALLESKEGKISSKKLKVEVEGNNLTQNDVYANYLSGNYKSIRVVNGPENGVSESEISLTK